MHQIISGETHKSEIFKYNELEIFLKKESEKYCNFKDKSCLYTNKSVINSASINYLNEDSNVLNDLYFVKDMIKIEFDKCESIYPYLGDIFIDSFFNDRKIKKTFNSFKFNNEKKKDFINSISDENVKNIAQIFFDNFSLEHTGNVEKYFENDIKIIKTNNLNFKVKFDNDFYTGKKVINNYNVIFLDGYIQSVGEIHHLLNDSNKNKKNYVLFCYGMAEDVKKTIILNNKNKKTFVYPISLDITEESLNLLNDIAALHNSVGVINAKSGKTISQIFTSKEKIDSGKKLTVKKGVFSIEPACSKKQLKSHRDFILSRVLEEKNINNKNLLEKRLSRFSNKNIDILIPEYVWRQNNFIRDLDYMLRFFANCDKYFVKLNTPDKKSFYYFSSESIFKLKQALDSFREKLNKIEFIITKKESK